jgi:hypothetical protein
VSDEIDKRFGEQPDIADALKKKFNVNTGVFGFRSKCTVHRMYVDSQTKTERFGDVSNLFKLHDDGLIDLYELAGFKRDCRSFDFAWAWPPIFAHKPGWYHPRHQTATFPFASGGGGFGEPTPPELTKEQLDKYIESKGMDGPHFRIYAVSLGDLDTKTNAAEEKGRQLGLMLSFERNDIEVTHEDYINWNESGEDFHDPTNYPNNYKHDRFGVQTKFLSVELGRHHTRPSSMHDDDQYKILDPFSDAESAKMELCSPASVAVFWFGPRHPQPPIEPNELRGLTNNLIGTTSCAAHNLDQSINSGVSFIDDEPDEARKYVLIHELGHYFGLCHVDGFARIMVSGKPGQGDFFTWRSIPNFIIHGGPRFIYTEAQRVWGFMFDSFPLNCLLGIKEEPPVIL